MVYATPVKENPFCSYRPGRLRNGLMHCIFTVSRQKEKDVKTEKGLALYYLHKTCDAFGLTHLRTRINTNQKSEVHVMVSEASSTQFLISIEHLSSNECRLIIQREELVHTTAFVDMIAPIIDALLQCLVKFHKTYNMDKLQEQLFGFLKDHNEHEVCTLYEEFIEAKQEQVFTAWMNMFGINSTF